MLNITNMPQGAFQSVQHTVTFFSLNVDPNLVQYVFEGFRVNCKLRDN